MSIDTLYGRQYEDNIVAGVQQMVSKMREKVTVKSGVRGDSKSFGWIDSVDAREKTVRHSDAVIDDPGHNRATAYLRYYYKKLMLDPDDEIKVIADPKSTYVKNTLASLRRKMDDVIISAAFGTKYTGQKGTSTSSFPATQEISADGTNVITLEKIIAALELFNDADVDENEEKYLAVSPKVLSELLLTDKLTSADYMTLKALVPGKMVNALGFNFMVTTRLPVSNNVRDCLAWSKSGLGLAVGKDITGKVDEDKNKHYSFFTYASSMIGATRTQDERVIKIQANEAKALGA